MNLDRPHRFQVGDQIVHIDDPSSPMTVRVLTARFGHKNIYPTYTLVGNDGYGGKEELCDVLDTLDLMPYTPTTKRALVQDDQVARDAAQAYNSDGRIEVDRHDAVVSWSEDSQGLIGAYVQAWVFVHVADLDLKEEE